MSIRYSLPAPFLLGNYSVQVVSVTFDPNLPVIPAHSHGESCYEIHYVPDGQGILEIEGKSISLAPGSLYVTGPHVVHAQLASETASMQEYCAYLNLTRRGRGKDTVPDAFCAQGFWIGQDDGTVRQLFQRMFLEFTQQKVGYCLQVQQLLVQLLVQMVRNYRSPANPVTSFPVMEQASLIIEEAFLYEYRTLTLSELSRRLQCSPRQTQRMLNQYYGSTFQKKKREARLSAAVELLRDKSLSIAEIADALGFSSSEHFSNTFRQVYGVSPSQYRK